MKKLILTALTIFAFTVQSCTKIDEPAPTPAPANQTITGEITASTTWTNDRIWIIDKKVVVKSGVTLTIQAGTIVKGTPGTGASCSALIIARGGKINATGTAANPIIFTAAADNIQVGQKAGTNLSATDNSLWGGLLILGKAKGSFTGDVTEFQIEGIPASDTFGLYGGSDDADNSGTLTYVSIRHGGAEIGSGNEINGLTLGCVGSATTINNVEVFATFDDGVEYFGGTVSTSNMFVYAAGDDGFDIDQSFGGTISNSVVVKAVTADSGLEIDGPEGSYNASFTLNKITLKGNAANTNKIAEYKSKARGASNNVYALNFPASCTVKITDATSSSNFAATPSMLSFMDWNVKASSLTGIFIDPTNMSSTFPNAMFATAVTAPATGVGADCTVFGWTLAKAKGIF
jgi:hypothetical protein